LTCVDSQSSQSLPKIVLWLFLILKMRDMWSFYFMIPWRHLKFVEYVTRSHLFLCSIQEILLLMMSMGEGWSFMILEWWEGTLWSSSGYLQLVYQPSPLSNFKWWLSFAFAYCSISPNIREGLLETFYGVYEKDPDKVIVCLKYGGPWGQVSLFLFDKLSMPQFTWSDGFLC